MPRRRRRTVFENRSGPLLARIALVIGALLASAVTTLADGGVVQLQQPAGPFIVTVFAAPSPLRAGTRADISVMVQDQKDGQPVLDGKVFVRLYGENGLTISAPAIHENAQNKLLYAAPVNFPEAGQWKLEVTIKSGENAASVFGEMRVVSSRPYLLSYWRSLALPPVIILLFAINQWLKRRAVKEVS